MGTKLRAAKLLIALLAPLAASVQAAPIVNTLDLLLFSEASTTGADSVRPELFPGGPCPINAPATILLPGTFSLMIAGLMAMGTMRRKTASAPAEERIAVCR